MKNNNWEIALKKITFDIDTSLEETNIVTEKLIAFIKSEKEKSYKEGIKHALKIGYETTAISLPDKEVLEEMLLKKK